MKTLTERKKNDKAMLISHTLDVKARSITIDKK